MKVLIENGKQDYLKTNNVAEINVCTEIKSSDLKKKKPLFKFQIINGKFVRLA